MSKPKERFSARGMAAIKRGLLPSMECATQMRIPVRCMVDAPKSEWHHDLITGEEIWFHNPQSVWIWWLKQKRKHRALDRLFADIQAAGVYDNTGAPECRTLTPKGDAVPKGNHGSAGAPVDGGTP